MSQEIIELLKLEPHPEGGYFRRTYTAQNTTDKPDGKTRQIASAIYFYLNGGDFSAWHKLAVQDEIFHYYAGCYLTIHLIDPVGNLSHLSLGLPNCDCPMALPQQIIPAGYWFAFEVATANSFCLMGCSLAPEFMISDFSLGKADELTAQFPQHADIIKRLTRE